MASVGQARCSDGYPVTPAIASVPVPGATNDAYSIRSGAPS